MEFRVTSDFKVKQVTLAFRIPFTVSTVRWSVQFYRDPNAWCTGIGSKCVDGRHVLFFDYDQMPFEQVVQDMQFLQKRWKLGPAHIFQLDREDSFHAIFLDKFDVSKAYTIIREANSDPGHRESVKKVRGHEWLLRTSKKGERGAPVWRGTLKSPYVGREISTAHKRFLEINYGVPSLEYKNEDGFQILPVISYNTGNRVEFEKPKEFLEPLWYGSEENTIHRSLWKSRGIK